MRIDLKIDIGHFDLFMCFSETKTNVCNFDLHCMDQCMDQCL